MHLLYYSMRDACSGQRMAAAANPHRLNSGGSRASTCRPMRWEHQEPLGKPRNVAHRLNHLLVLNARGRDHGHRPEIRLRPAGPERRSAPYPASRGRLQSGPPPRAPPAGGRPHKRSAVPPAAAWPPAPAASGAAVRDPARPPIRFAMPSTKSAGPFSSPASAPLRHSSSTEVSSWR